MSSIMTNLKDRFDLEETLVTLMMMSIAGLIIMWFFYVYFGGNGTSFEWGNPVLFLSLAIVFTILAPGIFAYLWFQKKKT